MAAKSVTHDRRAVRASSTETQAKLIAAATKEFNQRGYYGTDSNKIARRAGFAPQTFYRWFRDKAEIFVAAYRRWEDDEREMLAKLIAVHAPGSDVIDAVVAHHRAYRIFRRSLRTLAYDEPEVRAARARSRLRQIESVKGWTKATRRPAGEIATILFQIERLADALAENEFDDLGLDEKAARKALAELELRLRGSRPR